jgi:WD40 repeat protein
VATTSADKTARVWATETGAAELTLRGHTDGVICVAFSPDGTRVVTGSYDKTAKVWDARTGAEVLTLKGHTEMVVSAAFTPDGARVVTAGWECVGRTWAASPIDREFRPLPVAPAPRSRP